jgi:hypothetical protein
LEERIQFRVSCPGSRDIFDELSSGRHPRWPKLDGKSQCARASLRILAAFCSRPTGSEWLILRGDKPPFPVLLPVQERDRGGKWAKAEFLCSPAESALISNLLAANVARKRSQLMPLAVRFSYEIRHRLVGDAQLVRRMNHVDAAVDLRSLAMEEYDRRRLTPRIDEEREPSLSIQTDALYVITCYIVALNRFLASRVDAAILRSRQTHGDPKGLSYDALSEKWQRDLDLINLVGAFDAAEARRLADNGRTLFRMESENSRLFTGRWRERIKNIDECSTIGSDAVLGYLRARFGRKSDDAPAEPLSWRNWTRSRVCDGHREIATPIEWAPVLTHWIATNRGPRTENGLRMAEHDLQTLLLRAFGASNRRHAVALADTCRKFNQFFHGDAVIDGLTRTMDKRTAFPTIHRVLQPSEIAPRAGAPEVLASLKSAVRTSDDEKHDIASLCFIHLVLQRVIQPVFHWPVSSDSEPVLPEQVLAGQRAAAVADFSQLRARVFGAQLSIDGLSAIFQGGLVPLPGLGRSWLLAGGTGEGKSTMALALAADTARRGRIAVFISYDERIETVRERLVAFQLLDHNRFSVVTREGFEASLDDLGRRATSRSKSPRVRRPWRRTSTVWVCWS